AGPPAIIEFKPFVSALDTAASRRFYEAIGFDIRVLSETTCIVDTGQGKFVLAQHEGEGTDEAPKHQMLHLWVESADAWCAYLRTLDLGVKIPDPKLMPWGLRVCFVADPAGVLWHVAEEPKSAPT
ncbi:MAG: VOC family protein, partial [Myxococcota bacterium]